MGLFQKKQLFVITAGLLALFIIGLLIGLQRDAVGTTQPKCGGCSPGENTTCLERCVCSKNSLFFVLLGKETPLPDNTGSQPEACRVKKIEILGNGTSPDISADGKSIAYEKKTKGSYEIYLMNEDGSGSHCLTCSNIPGVLQGKHKGKATFHPDGKFLLFGAENEYGAHGLSTIPGIGENHDFWVRSLEDGSYWRLTHLPKDYALQYPRFSADGSKLLWSERYEKGKMMSKGCEYGFWRLMLANFTLGKEGPQISGVQELMPGGPGFYEPHGFSADGSSIIFTAAFENGKSQLYGEIYTYNLITKELTRITDSEDIHDEQSLYSPDGSRISLMSGPFVGLLRIAYKTDLYLMDNEGNNRVRLTHFNDPAWPEYTGGSTIINKDAWHPYGTEIISGYYVSTTREEKIFALIFEGPCGNGTATASKT
ncbi:hypothetical protein COY95_03635 [Candidatus Woesearchaeota archaeon CG_4_10_14_0_8_um_filter_47_5]|nr:MAG: hypothetical protein COY95_03635 [Candidatus Woesearchaeota archaeon CG_4_10_14_0_8_um_filter_47_5]